MHALLEEFPVDNDVMRLEPRIARIEGEITQLNSRVGGVELDLRELRKSTDQKLDTLDTKIETAFKMLDAKIGAAFEKLDGKFEKLDAKIDRIDAKFEHKLDAMSTRRFTLLVTLITAAATLAAAGLALMLGAAHLH
ncbi:MAG TPA: hypothetical protein VGN43_04190 [Steroidobacteraceae bacterium]|jgi:chromosome segregation ATPase|nr:hypothetical protein [Steroidobacteraceae bacterium]